MSEQENYKAAAQGRVGADRMALGLTIIPDKNRGDMDVIFRIQAKAQELERECDELQNTIADVLRALGAKEHEGPRLAAMRVKEERDQARRELDIQLESIKFHMERKFISDNKDSSKTLAQCIEEKARIVKAVYFDSSEELRKARTERDFCMSEIERLRKERDEAREDAKRATYDAAQETIKVSTVKSHWIQACRERDEAREALRDMLSGWKYIRSVHGDLYGVGWDRAQSKAETALEGTK